MSAGQPLIKQQYHLGAGNTELRICDKSTLLLVFFIKKAEMPSTASTNETPCRRTLNT